MLKPDRSWLGQLRGSSNQVEDIERWAEIVQSHHPEGQPVHRLGKCLRGRSRRGGGRTKVKQSCLLRKNEVSVQRDGWDRNASSHREKIRNILQVTCSKTVSANGRTHYVDRRRHMSMLK